MSFSDNPAFPKDAAGWTAFGHGRLPGLLGIQVVAIVPEKIVLELAVRDDLLAPNGYLHAGTVVSLADTAAGYGCIANLPEGAQGFTTVELKANLLGTALKGVDRAEAVPAHLGKTTQVWDVSCYANGGAKAIALFRCTQMVLWPKPAR